MASEPVYVAAQRGGTRANRVADPIAEVIERLRQDSSTLFGTRHAQVHVEVRMSRPFSRLAKVWVESGTDRVSLFVKVARLRSDAPGEFELMRDRVIHDYETTTQVYVAMPHDRGLSVVRPVACYPQHLAIVTETAPGDTLLQAAARGIAWWPTDETVERMSQVFGRVGQWIAAFQNVDSSRRTLSLAALREYADVRLVRLAENQRAGFSREDRERVLRVIDRELTLVNGVDLEAVPIHGDLALGNILVDRGRIIALDLAMTTFGSRYDDLAHLHMQVGLLRLKPYFRTAIVRHLQESLLRGYCADPVEREPLFRAMLLQHSLCHYLGLVERPAGLLSQAYNMWVARHHLAWLRDYAARSD